MQHNAIVCDVTSVCIHAHARCMGMNGHSLKWTAFGSRNDATNEKNCLLLCRPSPAASATPPSSNMPSSCDFHLFSEESTFTPCTRYDWSTTSSSPLQALKFWLGMRKDSLLLFLWSSSGTIFDGMWFMIHWYIELLCRKCRINAQWI